MSTSSELAPVVRAVTVDVPPEQAFATFTQRLAEWWPLEMFSLFGEKSSVVRFEERAGGRAVEVRASGEEAHWADVLEWEPPRRVVLAWKPSPDSPAPTELEVTFTSRGSGTRVEVEHRGWERLGALADEARAGYDSGWKTVLGLYAEHTGAAARS